MLKKSDLASRFITDHCFSDFSILYAVTSFGVALLLRNRTSRFRFWPVAAR